MASYFERKYSELTKEELVVIAAQLKTREMAYIREIMSLKKNGNTPSEVGDLITDEPTGDTGVDLNTQRKRIVDVLQDTLSDDISLVNDMLENSTIALSTEQRIKNCKILVGGDSDTLYQSLYNVQMLLDISEAVDFDPNIGVVTSIEIDGNTITINVLDSNVNIPYTHLYTTLISINSNILFTNNTKVIFLAAKEQIDSAEELFTYVKNRIPIGLDLSNDFYNKLEDSIDNINILFDRSLASNINISGVTANSFVNSSTVYAALRGFIKFFTDLDFSDSKSTITISSPGSGGYKSLGDILSRVRMN